MLGVWGFFLQNMLTPEPLKVGTLIFCTPADTTTATVQPALVQENSHGYLHHQVLLLLSRIIILMAAIYSCGTGDSTLMQCSNIDGKTLFLCEITG